MIRETSAPDSTVIIISSPGRGTGVRSELSIVQLRAISGVALGLIVEVWSEYRYGFCGQRTRGFIYQIKGHV